MDNITATDELLARSLITKWSDFYATKWGIPETLSKIMPYKHSTKGKDIVTYPILRDINDDLITPLSDELPPRIQELHFVCNTEMDLQELAASLYENYKRKQYRHLDVEDKIVVDIGASIGDTAILFALARAKHVYAFEPSPYAYTHARANILLNGLGDKITLINEAVGVRPSSITLDNKLSMGGSKLKETKHGKRIKITTLTQIVERFKIPMNSVLKIDVEGDEYKILLDNPRATHIAAIKKFNQICIEYHQGYLNLKWLLESYGYKTTHTLPRLTFYDPRARLGLLTAARKLNP